MQNGMPKWIRRVPFFPRQAPVRVLGHVFSVAGWRCCPALRFSLACAWTSDYAVHGAEKESDYMVRFYCPKNILQGLQH